MPIFLRKAKPEDRLKLFEVEKQSTPGLSYLPYVFDQFVNDESGDFSVAEADGEVVACGKFTLLPDGSAWLETLRVMPAWQGQGIGKLFYQRFFELGRAKNVPAMRMYTGIENVVSKGLAERYGFTLAATYRGQKYTCRPGSFNPPLSMFQPVRDVAVAIDLLMGMKGKWGGFMVLNRTWYAINPALAGYLVDQGMIYQDQNRGGLLVYGGRFMRQQALHIGLVDGDLEGCVGRAIEAGLDANVASIHCLYPPSSADVDAALAGYGFQPESGDFIVMEIHLR